MALKSLRLGVLCRDASGEIIGGTTRYLDSLATTGKPALSTRPYVSARPAVCEATVNETDA